MRKKLISIVTVFALMLSLIPTSFAFAGTDTEVNSDAAKVLNEYAKYYSGKGSVGYSKDTEAAVKQEFYDNAVAGMEEWLSNPEYDDCDKYLKDITDYLDEYSEYQDKKGTPEEIAEPELVNYYPLFVWADFVSDTEILTAMLSEENNENATEIQKCFLNSDILFKGKARIIEATQTRNSLAIITTVISISPNFADEVAKCLGLESSENDSLIFYDKVRAMCASSSTAEEKICALLSNDNLNPKATKYSSTVKLSWNAVKGIDGYEVYAKEADGTLKLMDKVTNASYTTGTVAQSYNIVEYIEMDGVTYRGKAYNVVPKLSNTKITKLYRGHKKFTVKWKKVSGANGYQIQYYRVSKYKKLRKGGTVYVKGNKAKATVKVPKAYRKYKVKIRPLYTTNGIALTGNWTKYKKIRVR